MVDGDRNLAVGHFQRKWQGGSFPYESILVGIAGEIPATRHVCYGPDGDGHVGRAVDPAGWRAICCIRYGTDEAPRWLRVMVPRVEE